MLWLHVVALQFLRLSENGGARGKYINGMRGVNEEYGGAGLGAASGWIDSGVALQLHQGPGAPAFPFTCGLVFKAHRLLRRLAQGSRTFQDL